MTTHKRPGVEEMSKPLPGQPWFDALSSERQARMLEIQADYLRGRKRERILWPVAILALLVVLGFGVYQRVSCVNHCGVGLFSPIAQLGGLFGTECYCLEER